MSKKQKIILQCGARNNNSTCFINITDLFALQEQNIFGHFSLKIKLLLAILAKSIWQLALQVQQLFTTSTISLSWEYVANNSHVPRFILA